MKRRSDLSAPRHDRRLDVSYDADAFGQFAESIAKYLGTARFLVWQSVVITAWIIHNLLAPERFVFDPWSRGFTLLTLVLSVQASYAAPLILLAQARQERRDRAQAETDRNVAERTQADTEFLAREIVGVRLAITDAISSDQLREELARISDRLAEVSDRLDQLEARPQR